MLRHALHEFEAKIRLKAESPLLVKDGRVPTEKAEREKLVRDDRARERMPVALPISRNSLESVVAALTDANDPLARAQRDLEFYIPGSSMKGAWRSHLERTLRGLTDEDDARVCDPLDEDGVEVENNKTGPCSACSKVLLDKKKQFEDSRKAGKAYRFPAYAMSCPICRMFGNTTLGSRIKISDGTRKAPGRLIQRDHVAINRTSGKVMRGPFKYFALQDAEFDITITLRNYELQHLVLTAVLLSDLLGARVPLGSGKSKGYGQVRATIGNLTFTVFGLQCPDGPIAGLAEHAVHGPAMGTDYRVTPVERRPNLEGFKADDLAPWRWVKETGGYEFFGLIKQIPLRWDKVPKLDQRLEFGPGRAPAWGV